MAPLPKRRHSTRRGGKRKAAIKLSLLGLVVCKNCKALILPHRICTTCGYYNGKPVIIKREKKKKKE
ncbi:TPA: 50S ribosomal protein L32 [Patescibacteria group bacterium]|nr:50S ribosomal protein L32 [Patescibacteria group bacterium]